MSTKRRIVMVGATSSIAVHCARLWLQRQAADLTLVGRSAQRLERLSSDLALRSPESDISQLVADFRDPDAIQETLESIFQRGNVDTVLIAHGLLPDQETCQGNLQDCREALEVNGVSPVLFAEGFANYMADANHGTIILIGSVAGDRGRKSNYVYGAAKGLVDRYAQGMQHRFAGTGVKVVLVKPGPTDTPMTAHLKANGAALSRVEDVAKCIVTGADKGKASVYAPAKWRYIMWALRHLPAFVFNRLDI